LLLALVSLGRPALAGNLGDVRSSTSKPSSTSDDDGGSDDDHGGSVVGSILLAIISGDDDADEPRPRQYEAPPPAPQPREPNPDPWFFAYPYADGQQGSMLLLTPPLAQRSDEFSTPASCPPDDFACTEQPASCDAEPCDAVFDRASAYDLPEGLRRKAGRLQLFSDFGTDVAGLQRYSVGTRFESRTYLGFESRWSYWREPLDDGGVDALVFADFTPFVRIVQTRHVQSYLGAGLHVMFDPTGADSAYGFQGSWSLEAYPVKPLTVNASLDVGNLGPVAFANAQATLGGMLGRVELFAGGHFMLVDRTVFAGPLGGLRLHL
jgi:hypothetical protein